MRHHIAEGATNGSWTNSNCSKKIYTDYDDRRAKATGWGPKKLIAKAKAPRWGPNKLIAKGVKRIERIPSSFVVRSQKRMNKKSMPRWRITREQPPKFAHVARSLCHVGESRANNLRNLLMFHAEQTFDAVRLIRTSSSRHAGHDHGWRALRSCTESFYLIRNPCLIWLRMSMTSTRNVPHRTYSRYNSLTNLSSTQMLTCRKVIR